jgi:hypothetical protein
MAGKNRRKSEREREDTPDAGSTAVDFNGSGTVAPAIRVSDPPDQPPSSDPGTPLPDDTNILKENVKGLKSKLRKHKQEVSRR